MNKFRITGLALAASLSLAACETAPPTIQQGPDAELSFDGLHKVDNSVAREAWARPDLDLSPYTKLMLVSSGFEYRQAKNMGRTTAERSRGGPYYLDEDRRARFEALVGEVFREEMVKIENWEFTTEPGPDVLMVRGALLDIVTFVPDLRTMTGNTDLYVTSVGEATLVLELRDSESGTILARSIDRRAAERMGRQMMNANTVTNAAEVRRLIRFWGQRLRENLDAFAAR
jgi:hypothetical protein